jgi:hypothetical protein
MEERNYRTSQILLTLWFIWQKLVNIGRRKVRWTGLYG